MKSYLRKDFQMLLAVKEGEIQPPIRANRAHMTTTSPCLASVTNQPGMPEVLFSCSNLLSMNFNLLISTEITKTNGNFRFKSQKQVIYLANKC